jgi:DNA-binding IclR family transcriptional regulator
MTTSKTPSKAKTPQKPKAPSKTAHVLTMLARPKGASLDALCKATGWQPHSTRAALSGLRKSGHVIERTPGNGTGGGSVYRITTETQAGK